ncbi:MAG: hypothetical protein EXQ52_00705 [Bryobacterales bacterium]|nr:hypothetical protein [Bryobacterales bacterium]
MTGLSTPPTGNFQFQRHWAGEPADWAFFETLRCPHAAGIRVFKLDSKNFTFSVKKGFFRTPGLPARIEIKIPSVCVVAAVAGVANNFGYGPFTTFPLSHYSEPDRRCNGGAYTFQVPGALAVADTATIPMRVQDSASIWCIYAYVQTPTTDGQSVREFVHVNLGPANEEYVEVLAADPVAQTFRAVFTKDHSTGATVRPTIWPTQILYEGDTLAFDILAVASPDPGSNLTVVIQT